MANDDLANQAWLARFRATPFYESSGEESSLPDEAADRITALEADKAGYERGLREAAGITGEYRLIADAILAKLETVDER